MFNHESTAFDWVFVGGGLQAALAVVARRAAHPSERIAVVETGHHLGGNHLWSVHEGALDDARRALLGPFVSRRWRRWVTCFTKARQTFDNAYASIESPRVDAILRAALSGQGDGLFLGSPATQLGRRHVLLADGRELRAGCVVDTRGPAAARLVGRVAYQKFLGLELVLDRPIDDGEATVFDADVDQHDGFRFFYRLPLARDRVLVEETFFSDHAGLDRDAARASILAHAAARGLSVREIVREEEGALPLPLDGPVAPPEGGPIVGGYAGGFFHPTTGYSLPLALRFALLLAASSPDTIDAAVAAERRRLRRQIRFALLLNRLLFRATDPKRRRDVLARFHALPEATILRFYALETTALDRARILCGRPPPGVSLTRALAQVAS